MSAYADTWSTPASSTAVNELRQLDEAPGSVDLIHRITDGLNEAHVSIGAQVDQDPSLNGTSTTATVGLFDGGRLALGTWQSICLVDLNVDNTEREVRLSFLASA